MFKKAVICKTLRKPNFNYGLLTFLMGLLLASALFIPAIIRNGGYFFYYGDFIAQEIPFYQMVHDAIRQGNYLWSSTTDLGSGVIGSYSFYLLGSPFFWLTLPFPSEAVPYLMGPLFILKFGCAALTAYIYIKRYVSNKTFAVAGGLLYAFSGFSIYNIFFFHFHEPMIIFPLLLASVDKFMYDNKRGVVALAVFAACITNYYFFAGMAVFVLIYWLMLVFTDNYKLTISKLLLFIFEVLLGFIATAVLILPTVAFISGNPRLSELPNSYDALAYNPSQRYIYIIQSFFFPPEMPAQMVFAPASESNWASVSGWLPLVGMTGVIGYLQLKKRNWLKKLITIFIIMAVVPIFNSAFQMFNSSIYYARWYYMLILLLCLATVSALENTEVDWSRAIKWTTGITVGIACLIALIPDTEHFSDSEPKARIGIYNTEYTERFFIYIAIAMVSLAIFAVIITKFKDNKMLLGKVIVCGILAVSLLSSTYIVQTGVSLDAEETEYLIEHGLNDGDKLQLDDIEQVRSDFYQCVDNLAMYWQIPSINAFHSTVTTSIMDFYDSIGINRDVASRPDTDYYGLRGLFSCKYLFDLKYDDKDGYSFVDEDGKTEMCGWKYLKEVNGCSVYENQYYIPMGFMYESFISQEEFENIDEVNRSEALLKAMVLSLEDMEKYSDITGYTEEKYQELKKLIKNNESLDKFVSETKYYVYGELPYYSDCQKLASNSCEEFEYTKDGFTAVIDNKGNDNLLFFSVPYDEGWTAYVNGVETEISLANVGFMAVEVPGNTKSNIKFVYNPVGFHIGIIISCVCGTIFVMYICVILAIRIKKRKKMSK